MLESFRLTVVDTNRSFCIHTLSGFRLWPKLAFYAQIFGREKVIKRCGRCLILVDTQQVQTLQPNEIVTKTPDGMG
jgi:hypothetical protein